MRRILLAIPLVLFGSTPIFAQQTAADSPATKEDVQRYFDVMHLHEMMTQMVDAMMKPMHQMLHEQFLKDKDKLPADFEDRTSKMLDDWMKSFPWDEMMQSVVPVYQKHLTKGDIDAIMAFYSAPTGQKLLRELPAMMSESTQAMMPLLRKQMDSMNQHMQQEVAQMRNDSKTAGGKAQAKPN